MESVENWSREYFLNNQDVCLQKLASLSSEEESALRRNLEQKAKNKIVKIRAMVMETFEPEFYCESYEVKNEISGSVRTEIGKFCDKLNINENETVDDPSKHLGERQTFFIAQPESTNEWAENFDSKGNKPHSNKRKWDEAEGAGKESFTVKVSTESSKTTTTMSTFE